MAELSHEANSQPATLGMLTQVADAITAAIKTRDEKIVALTKRVDALASTERRLSRHGEHLARLETRLQALEKR